MQHLRSRSAAAVAIVSRTRFSATKSAQRCWSSTDAARAKLKEAESGRIYQLAEMENVRRIASTDVRKAKEYACQPMAKGLLLALDNLDSALRAASPALAIAEGAGAGAGAQAEKGALAKPFTDLVEGLRATRRIFVKVMSEHGATQFGAVGDKFDANKFDAVVLAPPAAGGAGPAPGHVAQVLQSGYMFKDRVLRPCQVVVVDSKPAAA
jgi:molecular chaperone GrpE